MTLCRLLLPLLLASALAFPAAGQTAALQNTTITCDGQAEMVSTDTITTITFRDKVLLVGTNMKLSCDYLEVVVLRTGDKAATVGKLDKFRSLLATGNVQIVQGFREAACGRAEVLPGEDKVVLSGNPVVVDHDQDSRVAGEKITMLKGERRLLIERPILTGPPIKDLGVDKTAKPAAPATEAAPQP